MRQIVSLKTLLLIALLGLSACENAEQRAERYYQSGMTLLAAGDVERALVEFRNVFKLDGKHKLARETYARVQRDRGATSEAYSQYLRLVEQYPDDMVGLRALAEMAIENGSWEDADRYGNAARKLAPDDAPVRAIASVLDYHKALLAKDEAAARSAADAAQAVLKDMPESLIARRVVIDHLASRGDTAGALAQVDQALVLAPALPELSMLRLRLLVRQGDQVKVGAQLQDMFARSPEDEQVRNLLIAWYMQQGDSKSAEAVLRQLAEKTPAESGRWLTLIQFIQQTRGTEAAKAELDRLIALGGEKTALYRATKATMSFQVDKNPEAIAEMETILRDVPASEETRNMKLALAQMLVATGNTVGARARVEEVLAEDATNVEALKMRAAWLIDEDKPGDAIIALRAALDQNPRDPAILTLMGQAHERDGSRELAGERYALAVEVSGKAPEESLRYATYLIADNKLDSAASVLEDALRISPQQVTLLVSLADVRMRQSDWDRTTQVISQLRAINTEDASRAANGIEAGLMLRQEKVDDTVNFLQGLIDGGDNDAAVVATIVQTRVRSGDLKAARDYLDERLGKAPTDPQLRLLSAGLSVLQNDPTTAEATYRALIAELPKEEAPVRALYALLVWQGKTEDAKTLLDTALTAMPDSSMLRMIRATELEKSNDINGAIAIYEAIYARDSSNTVVANNLASLIATHQTDPASLERAFSIARRLRGLEVPAFQDTYGWIEYRRGNFEEALTSLEPAAKGLPNDPLVQYHLGKTYLALDRKAEARKTLATAVQIAGDSPLPQFADARKLLVDLPAGN